MIIRVETSSEKGASCKAIKVVAGIKGETLLCFQRRTRPSASCVLKYNRNISCAAARVRRAGVESVTLAGEGRNLLLVIGVGLDSNRITKKLRQKVGHAEVVELRTVDAANELVGLVPADHAYRYHPSPYNKQQQHHAAARDHYNNSAGGYPRDHNYNGGRRSAYPPPTVAPEYQYGYGGGYPAQYQQQHLYQYQPPASNMHTVVHREYANDPNSCSIM
jgi:hypothetical protein